MAKMSHEKFLSKCKEREDFIEYEVLSTYKSSRENVKFKHLTCNREFDMKANNFTSNKQKCPHCSKNKKIDDKEFKKRVFDKVGNEYTFLDKYKNISTKLNVLHNTCGKNYKVTPNDFLNGNYRCPYCSNHKQLTKDEIRNRVIDIDSNYDILEFLDYENVHSSILFIHKECNRTFKKSFNNYRNGQRCPHCIQELKESKAMNEIIKLLEDNNIKYEKEITFKDLRNPKTNKYLRIDLFLPDFNLYIEYDGKQHFKYSELGYFTKEKFDEIKYRDKLKNDYFNKNNLNLLRINYNQDHKKIINEIINSTTIMYS